MISFQVPLGFSPQKWTDIKGHSVKEGLFESRGRGWSSTDTVLWGEINEICKFPLGWYSSDITTCTCSKYLIWLSSFSQAVVLTETSNFPPSASGISLKEIQMTH